MDQALPRSRQARATWCGKQRVDADRRDRVVAAADCLTTPMQLTTTSAPLASIASATEAGSSARTPVRRRSSPRIVARRTAQALLARRRPGRQIGCGLLVELVAKHPGPAEDEQLHQYPIPFIMRLPSSISSKRRVRSPPAPNRATPAARSQRVQRMIATTRAWTDPVAAEKVDADRTHRRLRAARVPATARADPSLGRSRWVR